MAGHCWWCTVLWCMDFHGSFVWCRRAIDSGGSGGGGGGGGEGGGRRGGGQAPHCLLGEGVGARHWAGGQYRGSQHIVLPSQPVCNLSHTCNGWWKKDCGEKKGGRSGKKEQLDVFWDFFLWLWQMRDQSGLETLETGWQQCICFQEKQERQPLVLFPFCWFCIHFLLHWFWIIVYPIKTNPSYCALCITFSKALVSFQYKITIERLEKRQAPCKHHINFT